MKVISIKRGNFLYVGTRKYEVINALDFEKALLRDVESGETGLFPILQLRVTPEGEAEEKSGYKHAEHIPDNLWEIAKKRYEIIKPLLRADRTKSEVTDRANEFGYSYSAVNDWIKRYEAEGILSSLVPLYHERGGVGDHRVDKRVDTIIDGVLEEIFLNSQRLKPKKVYEEVKKKCKNAGLKIPHKNTILNRIKEMSKRQIIKAREGSGKSSSIYEPVTGSFKVLHPLDVLQIDETPLDIIVVDDVYRLPIGRPFITVAEDINSRMAYGFYLSLEHPGFTTVGQCLYIGIMPKEQYLRNLKVDGEWEIWGMPKAAVIHTDNAEWYRGKDLKRFCDEYHVSISFRPKGKPKYGGHIERFIGTLNNEIHSLPGTTFSDSKEKGDYDSEKKAVMTLKELETWIANFIVNVYHKRPHKGIGDMLPKKKYELGIFGDETTPGIGLPDIIQGEDAKRLRISLLPSVERTIQRDGITIDKIPYYSDVLRKYAEMEERGKKKKKYVFKRDPEDISILFFYAPDLDEYFPIPYRNVGFPPISIWELRKIQKRLKDKNIEDYDEYEIFGAYEEMKRIENEATKQTKAVRRMNAMKKHHKEKKGKTQAPHMKATEPLHKTAKSEPEGIRKAVEARLDDIFSNPKPFGDIEVVTNRREKGDEDER